MTKKLQSNKEMEIIAWMTKQGYDRKASQEIAPIILQYIQEEEKNIEFNLPVICRFSEQLTEQVIKNFPRFFDDFDGWQFGDGVDAGKRFKKIYKQAKKLNRMVKNGR